MESLGLRVLVLSVSLHESAETRDVAVALLGEVVARVEYVPDEGVARDGDVHAAAVAAEQAGRLDPAVDLPSVTPSTR